MIFSVFCRSNSKLLELDRSHLLLTPPSESLRYQSFSA